MNKLLTILLIIILQNCSFDNKTGIWKNENRITIKKDDKYIEFKKLFTKEKTFNKIIAPDAKLNIKFDPIKISEKWHDEFYQNTNNLDNFSYNLVNKLIFKSKKLSKNKKKDNIFYNKKNIITTNAKGDIIIFSIENNKVIYQYNFYKKKFKKLPKNLNIIIEKDIIYSADNLGYLYALDYKKDKILWAVNYEIPFRSNIKIFSDIIAVSDQNNMLHFINKTNGQSIKFTPTEETVIKNSFINSLASNDNFLFYLNTFGSLYAFDNKSLKINWFINLNASTDINVSDIFYSNSILLHDNMIVISTDPYLYAINQINGSQIFKLPVSSVVKPIISGQSIFIVTKDNLLVNIDINTGKIIYSIDIASEIGNFLEIKKKNIYVKHLFITNNYLRIFLDNSYSVSFDENGKINKIDKFKYELNSFPLFINNSMMYLNKKNKLIVLN